jgi:hypothetical protein
LYHGIFTTFQCHNASSYNSNEKALIISLLMSREFVRTSPTVSINSEVASTIPDNRLSRTGLPRGYCLTYLLLKKIHVQNQQIHIGIQYKNPIYYQARATKNVLHHGNLGGFLDLMHIYLLRFSFDAGRTIMGIKYILLSPQTLISAFAAMEKNWCWVLAQHNFTHNHLYQSPATKEASSNQAPSIPIFHHADYSRYPSIVHHCSLW